MHITSREKKEKEHSEMNTNYFGVNWDFSVSNNNCIITTMGKAYWELTMSQL